METVIFHSYKYILAFFTAFITVYLLTPLIRKWAPALGMVDHPGLRRIHKQATPRGGGLAIVIAVHLTFLLVFKMGWTQYAGNMDFVWWQSFALGSGVIVGAGLFDDIKGIKPWIKLACQALAGTILFAGGTRFGVLFGTTLPMPLDFLITLFWILALTNAFNLIDGLDGLATGLCMITACGLAGALFFRRMPTDALIVVALAGACLAFLRYNFHPASIFLGDTGSMFLGYALAAFALVTSSKGAFTASLGVPLLAMGVPIFDTLLAIWRRSIRMLWPEAFPERPPTKGVMKPDAEHIHHRFLDSGMPQRQTALLLYLLNLVLVLVALLLMIFKSSATGIYLIAFVLGVYIVVRHIAHVELWDTGQAIVTGLHRPAKKEVAFIVYPIWDILCLTAALFVSMLLLKYFEPKYGIRENLLREWPVWIVPVFICLVLSKTYNRVWSRGRFGDYFILNLALGAGVIFSLGLSTMIKQDFTVKACAMSVVYAAISHSLLAGSRLSFRGIRDLMSMVNMRGGNHHYDNPMPVLLFGAGDRCIMFLREYSFRPRQQGPKRIIAGIVDDDPNLRKRLVSGFKVLGDRHDLPALIQQLGIGQIIITAKLKPEIFSEIKEIAATHGVTLINWHIEEREV